MGLVIVLVAWGAWETRSQVGLDTVLAGPEDVEAMQWIEHETSSDAVFLIDASRWGNVWRGADGGWWISPLTGRRTVLPPAMYLCGESAEIRDVHRLADETLELEKESAVRLLCKSSIAGAALTSQLLKHTLNAPSSDAQLFFGV